MNSRNKLGAALPRGLGEAVSRHDVFRRLSDTGFGHSSAGGHSSTLQGSTHGFLQQVTDINKQLGDLKTVQQNQIDTTKDNTLALAQSTLAKAASAASVLSTIGQGASSLFSGGSLLSPIINGILGLFGGSTPKVTPLTPFKLPQPVSFEGGFDGVTPGISGADYGQNGQPRAINSASASKNTANVTVHVTAMDSKSFLDHSEDIAAAVRQAMLHSNSLNDVVSDL